MSVSLTVAHGLTDVGIAVVAPRGQSLGLRSLARTAPIETLELRPVPDSSAQKGWCKCPQSCLPSRPAQATRLAHPERPIDQVGYMHAFETEDGAVHHVMKRVVQSVGRASRPCSAPKTDPAVAPVQSVSSPASTASPIVRLKSPSPHNSAAVTTSRC